MENEIDNLFDADRQKIVFPGKLFLKHKRFFKIALGMTGDEVLVFATFWPHMLLEYSVQTIQAELSHVYKKKISIRTIQYALEKMEKAGLVRRLKAKERPVRKEVWLDIFAYKDTKAPTAKTKLRNTQTNEVFYKLTKVGENKIKSAIVNIMGGPLFDEPLCVSQMIEKKDHSGWELRKFYEKEGERKFYPNKSA